MDMIPHAPTEARFYLLILFPTHINARDGGGHFHGVFYQEDLFRLFVNP